MDDPTALINDSDFLLDFCRFSEGLLDEKFLRKKYHCFTDDDWARLGESDELVSAIEAEKIRRIRDGSAKRELAQKHIVRGPDVLNSIMMDASASPKHRIDSARTLDQFAANGPGAGAADSTRFIIQINLGDDHVERYNKSRAIDADDVDPRCCTGRSGRGDSNKEIEKNREEKRGRRWRTCLSDWIEGDRHRSRKRRRFHRRRSY
jgi:hypothetical protein